MKELLGSVGLTSDDARLVTSIPKHPGHWFLPVTINNRYVLAPYRKKTEFLIGIIYGAEFEQLPELKAKIAYHGCFDPLRGEQREETPFFLRFKQVSDVALLDHKFKEGWIQAAKDEAERAKSSSFRKFHEPAVYEAAMNLSYRNKLLDEAF